MTLSNDLGLRTGNGRPISRVVSSPGSVVSSRCRILMCSIITPWTGISFSVT